MKIEQLLVQYLYNNKSVTLQEIGTFTLSPDVVFPTDNEKEAVLPENAVHFEYNTKATQDDGLIDFIVQQTRKIRPLATSDLESYTILGREYLNIGKPYPIEGLGTLQKSQSGKYEFVQGSLINPKLQAAPNLIREKEGEEINFSTPARKSSARRNSLIGIGSIVILLLVASAIYYLYKEKQQLLKSGPNIVTNDSIVNRPDTASLITNTPPPSPAVIDSSWKLVVREYPDLPSATKQMATYNSYGHNFVVHTIDSSRFYVAMPFTKPLADTARIKDSINRFFGTTSFVVQ